MSFSPNCPFCKRPLKLAQYVMSQLTNNTHCISFVCEDLSCRVDGEFPRYLGLISEYGDMMSQGYALGSFYVKVYPGGTCIYRLMSYMLMDEVKIPRAMWLNLTNTDATLDKIRTLIIFS